MPPKKDQNKTNQDLFQEIRALHDKFDDHSKREVRNSTDITWIKGALGLVGTLITGVIYKITGFQ